MILEMAVIISNLWAIAAILAGPRESGWCVIMCVAWALVGLLAAVVR